MTSFEPAAASAEIEVLATMASPQSHTAARQRIRVTA